MSRGVRRLALWVMCAVLVYLLVLAAGAVFLTPAETKSGHEPIERVR